MNAIKSATNWPRNKARKQLPSSTKEFLVTIEDCPLHSFGIKIECDVKSSSQLKKIADEEATLYQLIVSLKCNQQLQC